MQTMTHYQYLHVLSLAPLIIIRVPLTGPAGGRRYVMQWRALLRSLTPIMKDHGLRRRDISSIENLAHADEPSDVEQYAAVGAAFDGGPGFKKFWLYDWQGDGFVLIHEGAP
jgi:hypothetical protein